MADADDELIDRALAGVDLMLNYTPAADVQASPPAYSMLMAQGHRGMAHMDARQLDTLYRMPTLLPAVGAKVPVAKKPKVKAKACQPCREAHAGCSGGRPCTRCLKRGIESSCTDPPAVRKRKLSSLQKESVPNSLFKGTSDAVTPATKRQKTSEVVCNHGWEQGLPDLASLNLGEQQAHHELAQAFETLISSAQRAQTLAQRMAGGRQQIPGTEVWYKQRQSADAKSIWRVRVHRADDWHLEECNEEFLELLGLQTLPDLWKEVTLLGLTAPKLRVAMSSLLQSLIVTESSDGEAKSVLRCGAKGGDQTCVQLIFHVLSPGRKEAEDEEEEAKESNEEKAGDEEMREAGNVGGGSVVGVSVRSEACATTGCGAFREEWKEGAGKERIEEEDIQEVAPTPTATPDVIQTTAEEDMDVACGDSATIEEEGDDNCCVAGDGLDYLRVMVTLKPCALYDDARVIGRTVHCKTFSMPATEAASLLSSSAQMLRRKKKNPE